RRRGTVESSHCPLIGSCNLCRFSQESAPMSGRLHFFCVLTLAVFGAATIGRSVSAQARKPLVNADVVEMVKNELPESTIVAAIQANPINFDISPAALIALKSAGVSARIMDAMLAESKRRTPAAFGVSSSTAGRIAFGIGASSSITVAAVSSDTH